MTRARLLRERDAEREAAIKDEVRQAFARAREQGGALREAIVRGHGCCLINDPEFDQTLWDEALAESERLLHGGRPGEGTPP